MYDSSASSFVPEVSRMRISSMRWADVNHQNASEPSVSSPSLSFAQSPDSHFKSSGALSEWLNVSPQHHGSASKINHDAPDNFDGIELEYPEERQPALEVPQLSEDSNNSSQDTCKNNSSFGSLSSTGIALQDSVHLSATNLLDQLLHRQNSTPRYSPVCSTLLSPRNSFETHVSPCFQVRSSGLGLPFPFPVSPSYSYLFNNADGFQYSPFGRNLDFIQTSDWNSFEPFVSPVVHRNDAEVPKELDPAYQSFSNVNPATRVQDKQTPFMKRLLTALPTSTCSPPNSPMHAVSHPRARSAQDILNYQDDSISNPAPLLSPCKSIQFRYQPAPLESNTVSTSVPTPAPTIMRSSVEHLAALENDASGSEPSSCNVQTTPARPPNARSFYTPLTPLTPLTDDEDSIPPALRAKRKNGIKRTLSVVDTPSPSLPRKRFQRLPPQAGYATLQGDLGNVKVEPKIEENGSHANATPTEPVDLPQRTIPATFPKHMDFASFYRRFPTSTYFPSSTDESCTSLFNKQHPGGNYNPPRDAFDLYTPRFVKGKGKEKVGLCPICLESVERGGEGKKVWLSMKFSAFKCYHMQYQHGISAVTALPFSPPIAFRVTPRPHPAKKEKSEIVEGKCHKCRKWVAIEGVKDMDIKVKELFWWKHAAACHQGSMIEGETDFWLEDQVYMQLKSL